MLESDRCHRPIPPEHFNVYSYKIYYIYRERLKQMERETMLETRQKEREKEKREREIETDRPT